MSLRVCMPMPAWMPAYLPVSKNMYACKSAWQRLSIRLPVCLIVPSALDLEPIWPTCLSILFWLSDFKLSGCRNFSFFSAACVCVCVCVPSAVLQCVCVCLLQIAAKYEVEKEQEAREWMEEVLGEPIDSVSGRLMHLHHLYYLQCLHRHHHPHHLHPLSNSVAHTSGSRTSETGGGPNFCRNFSTTFFRRFPKNFRICLPKFLMTFF